jgi:hypothetical protein
LIASAPIVGMSRTNSVALGDGTSMACRLFRDPLNQGIIGGA